jgi:PAB-dependent poly(A)-specific ribonuclease subunit 3
MHQAMYDPYVTPASSLVAQSQGPQSQINPYAQEANGSAAASYYQSNAYTQPVQYHLYAPLGPHREGLLPYQKAAHDFFIPDNLREELQRKSAATLQTLPSEQRSRSRRNA